jgi:hypothetical protein
MLTESEKKRGLGINQYPRDDGIQTNACTINEDHFHVIVVMATPSATGNFFFFLVL